MKYLKWPLIILVGLIAIYLLLCAIGPKNMDTKKSTTINAPAAVTYNLYNNLKEWKSWSPWAAMDTSMTIKYGTKSEGLGATYTWQGDPDLTGAGNMKITETVLNESADFEMFFEDYGSSALVKFTSQKEDSGTKVTWEMIDKDELHFLLRGMMLVGGMKGKLAESFDQGLAAMKSIAENRANGKYSGYQISSLDSGVKHYIMNRQEVNFANISQFYAGNLAGLFTKAQASNVAMDGKPCRLFFKYDQQVGKADVAAAIPIKEALSIPGTMSYTIPASRALSVDYYGDYASTGLAHNALDAYMRDNGLLHNAPVLEEHITDPGEEPDPSKWLTKVTYFLAESN